MTIQKTAYAENDKPQLSPAEKEERKQRVLTQGTPSVTSDISDAVVIKDEDMFFLAAPDGDVPLEGEHGFGLYYHDCRFLNGYEMKLAGSKPTSLVATAALGFRAIFQLTNPDIRMADGTLIPKEQIGIKWVRMIDSPEDALRDLITIQNFGLNPISFPISFAFRAEFEDVFAVRGLYPEKLGELHSPEWQRGALNFTYDGADNLYRSVLVRFSLEPDSTAGTTAQFNISLRPEETRQILMSVFVKELTEPNKAAQEGDSQPDMSILEASLHRSSEEWLSEETEVRSDSLLLNNVIDRSLRDLRVLRSKIAGEEFFSAGVPWFATLFGRDSILTALQTLAFDASISEQTLRLLAKYQGQRVDEWRDEQPGKILHELRIGEMARTGQIPHTPYYGSVDATPLFLVLVARHAAWTGSLALFNELRSNIEMALEWMSKYGDLNGNGYIEYASKSEKGLINQGWKDSGDAIVTSDGSLAAPPIALVEVQGYVYMAKVELADLYRRAGEPARADELLRQAEGLRTRFNQDFWLEDKGTYSLALQKGGLPAAVISSNAGHALWSGIADADKAARTVERLMAEDMFNGWGVRTLSQKERRYNPVGYHLGTVWPHDNSIIAAGLRRYGFDGEATRVFSAIMDATMHFRHNRLPEVFAGFDRTEYGVPVSYPVACHPQAWAAGSVPYLCQAFLGLMSEAFDQRLNIVQPLLPEFVDRILVRRLKVGSASVDLRFERVSNGAVAVTVLDVRGQLDVIVKPGIFVSSRSTSSLVF